MKKPLLCLLVLIFSLNRLAAQPGTCAGVTTTITPVTSCGSITGQTLLNATATGSPTNSVGTANDVWYRFTTPANIRSLRITTSNGGSAFNNNPVYIEAFNASACGSVSTGTSIGTATRNNGLTLANLTPSTTYYFRVFTTANPNSGAWGFSVCVSYTTPSNDACGSAIVLTTGTTNTAGSISNATASGSIPVDCATGTPDDDIWYSFVASRTYATIAVSGGSTLVSSGAMIQLFSGGCGGLATRLCGKDAINDTNLTPGATYHIRVYSAAAYSTTPVSIPSNGFSVNISVTPGSSSTVGAGRMNEIYRQSTLSTSGIVADPWEITYGPDNYLWITEAKGYKVFRMDPDSGSRTTVLDLSRGSTFFSAPGDQAFNAQFDIGVNNPQGGFAGLALHPQFMAASSPQNYVYVSYVHSYGGGSSPNGIFYTNRLVRFTYNPATNRLESPESLCDTLPGSNDHNSQRMIIAPVSGTNYLFYAQGDMGAGQFNNRDRPNRSQIAGSYEGKILRFNLIEDGDANTYQKWIPNTNPYSSTSAVWTIGIRNNQGFAYDTTTGKLYGSSHGPYSDDEINIIEGNKNYGHPYVIGYAADDNYNGSTAGAALTDNSGNSSCPAIVDESDNAAALINYKDPLFSAYDAPRTTVNNIWQTNPGNGGWPSEGWSGMDIYKHTIVPGWKNSLVVGSLKWGRVLRLKLDYTVDTILATAGYDTVSYFGSTNRFRDLAFAPNGKDMYVVMDRSTTSSGPSAASPIVPACGGCIQKYTFLGYADVAGKSSIPAAIPVSPGTLNTCADGTTIVIDTTNNNLWVPITGPDGNIMAEIKANNNNLGVVTSSFYTKTGPVRQRMSKRYLNRNIRITPTSQPSSPVSVRFYISKAEFDSLDHDPGSGIVSMASIKIMKNDDPCGPALINTTQLTDTTMTELHGTDGYVLQADINSFSSFYFGNQAFTLPLELVYFKGSLQNTSTLLQWKTINENNTSHFIVERSIDGRSFAMIGSVDAAGNSTSTSLYSYIDNEVTTLASTVIYYRLKMVDIGGEYSYTSIVTIYLADITNNVIISPNPTSGETKVSISSTLNGKAQWKLMDNSGRVVMQNTIHLKKGNNSMTINLRSLADGLYYLSVSGAGIDQNVKLQKL